ncbi:hypothetical protein C8Q77DRAFT_1085735 [Trametes polyzona]|nr:hypothetical protein C8Q77DRAFT_1085735 [Trametes polyzona]
MLPASSPDPFRAYSDFPAVTRSSGLSTQLEAVELHHVLCHFARWTMPLIIFLGLNCTALYAVYRLRL